MNLKAPIVVRKRGRPRATRFKASSETFKKKSVKRKKGTNRKANKEKMSKDKMSSNDSLEATGEKERRAMSSEVSKGLKRKNAVSLQLMTYKLGRRRDQRLVRMQKVMVQAYQNKVVFALLARQQDTIVPLVGKANKQGGNR